MTYCNDPMPAGYKLPPCACGAEAVIFTPGSEGETAQVLGQTIPLRRGSPDLGWCMPCARASGWPNYASERASDRRRTSAQS